MNKDVFRKGFAMLTSSFPDRTMDPESLYALIKDIEDKVFLEAIIKTCNQPNPFYKDSSVAGVIRKNSIPETNSSKEDAFSTAIYAAERIGSWGKQPEFKDSLITKTLNVMGWKEFCQHDLSDRQIVRAQFFRIYESYKDRQVAEYMNSNVKQLVNNTMRQIYEHNKKTLHS